MPVKNSSFLRVKLLAMSGIFAMAMLMAWVFTSALAPSHATHDRIAELIVRSFKADQTQLNELQISDDGPGLQCQIVPTLSRYFKKSF